MKRALLIFTSILMYLMSTAQRTKEDNFAQVLLETFKAKNFNDFKKLNMDKHDFLELISDMQANAFYQGSNDELIKSIKAFELEADSVYKEHFQSLLHEGEKIGVNWSEIKKDEFVYKTDKPGNTSNKILSGHINFQSKNEIYVLFGVEAVELSTGYKINTIRAVLKGGVKEYVAPDLLE